VSPGRGKVWPKKDKTSSFFSTNSIPPMGKWQVGTIGSLKISCYPLILALLLHFTFLNESEVYLGVLISAER
jgi:hypothetical protein